MKTREVSKMLYKLARLLDSLPNTEVEKALAGGSKEHYGSQSMSNEALLVNLDTLINLSSIDKKQWLDFAIQNNIEIEHRPRDASRDVLGKILNYLEKNPETKILIQKKAEHVSPNASNELSAALRFLLKR